MGDYCCCGHNDLVFDHDCNEMVCQTCGSVNVANRYSLNGSIIDMDDTDIIISNTSIVSMNHLDLMCPSANDEYNIDTILAKYKQQQSENKPTAFGYYPRAADYTASGRMATMISNKNRDFAGNSIKHYKQAERMKMTSKIVNSKGNKEMSYRSGMQFIVSLSEKLFVNQNIKEKAATLFKMAYEKGLVKAKSHRGIAIASLFYACKEHGTIRDINDTVRASNENRAYKNFSFLHYKQLVSTLELDPIVPDNDVQHEIDRPCCRFDIEEKVKRKAHELCDKLVVFDKSIFFGKSPTISALCISIIASRYFPKDLHLRYSKIKTQHDISFITVKNRFDSHIDIFNKINEPLPDSIVEGKPS